MAEFSHFNKNCGVAVRGMLEFLESLSKELDTTGTVDHAIIGTAYKDVQLWIPWYFAHHCKRCGVCDTIEPLPPEQGGLCIDCWKDEQSMLTPSA